jgi:YfiH family protein
MIHIQKGVSDYFQFNQIQEQKGVVHFITTNIRRVGNSVLHDFDLSFSNRKNSQLIASNREILSEETCIPLPSFVMQEQIHSDFVQIVGEEHKGLGVYQREDSLQHSDAMITNRAGICLFLFAADCVPVLIYDPINRAIGAAHSGWKGTVKKIAQKTLIKMQTEYGTSPGDVLIGLGPSIRVKRYEVGLEVVNAVEQAYGRTSGILEYDEESERHYFNLQKAILSQLTDIGVEEANVEDSGLCSYDLRELFFSARREKNTGRFGAGIMLK